MLQSETFSKRKEVGMCRKVSFVRAFIEQVPSRPERLKFTREVMLLKPGPNAAFATPSTRRNCRLESTDKALWG